MVWYGFMQTFYALEYHLYWCGHIARAKQFHHFDIQFFRGEWCVDVSYWILHVIPGLLQFFLACLVCVGEELFHAAFLYQCHASLECDEVADLRHVDAVEVRIANLRCGADDDNLLRVQSVENADDALAQCRAAHNTVVDNHEVVHVRYE